MSDNGAYDKPRLLTPKELAERLNVSVAVVYRNTGTWPSVKIGNLVRFDYDQVMAYLQGRQDAVPPSVEAYRLPDDEWRKWREIDGDVYFIQADVGGLIKIGTTVNIMERLADLQMGCPHKLMLLAMCPGGQRREIELHQRFRDARKHGEWFEPVPELMEFIEECKRVVAA